MWITSNPRNGLRSASRAEAADLVNRLASARFADRNAASAELEGMGSDALPALRAVSSSTDADLRARGAIPAREDPVKRDEAGVIGPARRRSDRHIDEILKDSENRWPNRLAWHPGIRLFRSGSSE